MKRLTQDLKRMLAGLAYQDAGEYLSTQDKSRLLGNTESTTDTTPVRKPVEMQLPTRRHIALISDGRGDGAPLDYAIEAAQRQQAQIDLLLHGPTDDKRIANFERRLQQTAIPYRCIWLVEPMLNDLVDYMTQQTSLIFVVAMPDDDMARTLVEEVIPNRADRVSVPLVLIEAKQRSQSPKQSAA